MKKTILYLITALVILSSCEKEEDLLQPIPSNTTTQNTNTTNTDTLVINGDTIITNNGGTGNEVELLNEGLVVATNNTNGGVTILPPSATFVGAGKNYNVKRAEFSMNCSELTNQHFDTSYSYVTTNWTGPNIVVPGYPNGIGNGIVQFSQFQTNGYPLNNGVEGYFYTTTYPKNGSASPSHSYNGAEVMFPANIVSYSYTPGVITLNLVFHPCTGNDIYWSATMEVTEYSDGTIALSIDNGPHTFAGVTWNSHLKVILEEE